MADDVEPTTEFKESSKSIGPTFDFTTLDRATRKDIVELTASTDANAAVIQVNNLELSPLGANVDLDANWKRSHKTDLASWSEIGQGGRTIRSVVVRRGYLFPLGHEAVLTTTIVRTVGVVPKKSGSSGPTNYPVGYLQEQTIVHVTEPVKNYPAPGQPFHASAGASDWPFGSVRMTTLTSPLIDTFSTPKPHKAKALVAGSKQALWITSGGVDVNWNFVAVDLAGHDIAFSMPLAFVYGYDKFESGFHSEFSDDHGDGDKKGHTKTFALKLAEAYNGATSRTHSRISGAKLQFAEPLSSGKHAAGQTTHPTLLIQLGAATTSHNGNAYPANFSGFASTAALEKAGQPNFYPTIKSARIKLHAAETLTGKDFHDTRPAKDPLPNVGGVQFKYFSGYVVGGAAALGKTAGELARDRSATSAIKAPVNHGAVYLQAVNHAPLQLPGSSVGGIGTPSMGITGMSAVAGHVGGNLDNWAKNAKASAKDYFPKALSAANKAIAQLLGGLKLHDILDDGNFVMPTISSQVDPTTGLSTVTYLLSTPLKSWGPTVAGQSTADVFVPDPASDDSDDGDGDDSSPMFHLTATFQTPAAVPPAAPGPPAYSVTGSIDPFTIYLVGQGSLTDFLSLHFESVSFTAGSGASSNVVVNLDTTTFDGVLEFMNALEEFLSSLGGGVVSIDVTPTQASVSASLALPDVPLGLFTLGGISINAGVVIPFIDGPAVATFSFANAADPFTVTVAMFGGGGYVALALGYDQIHSVTAQFEFTGQFALDVVVASGSVSVVAGIYFSYTVPDTTANPPTGGVIQLTGFIRITGQIMLLGILMVSAELDLTLSYASEGGSSSVVGIASFKASVSICGFSKTVSFSVRKQFAGSPTNDAQTPAIDHARHAHEVTPSVTPAAPAVPWSTLVPSDVWTTYCGAFLAVS